MKKVLFAMLVSGMLFSCTNNEQSEEQQTADSTAQVSEATLAPVEEEVMDSVEVEFASDTLAADSSAAAIQ